jgi:hypothetical protein
MPDGLRCISNRPSLPSFRNWGTSRTAMTDRTAAHGAPARTSHDAIPNACAHVSFAQMSM